MEPLEPSAQFVIRREQLPLLSRPYAAPRTSTERSLAEIWSAALNLDQVGIDDHYPDLGGDSLIAAVIFSKIEAKLGARLRMVGDSGHVTQFDQPDVLNALLLEHLADA